jgi:hypothetical protein
MRAHDIPLSKTVLAILRRQPRVAGRGFIFGEGEHGFQGFSKAKAALDARAKLNLCVPNIRFSMDAENRRGKFAI